MTIADGIYNCADCNMNIKTLDKFIRVRIDGKYEFFFNKDGSFDGIGVLFPTPEEIEQFGDILTHSIANGELND